jgi:hypothetical protein
MTFRYEIQVLSKHEFMSRQELEHEIFIIQNILYKTEPVGQFCQAHELVCRNYITSKKHRLLEVWRQETLKPFWFLICKN